MSAAAAIFEARNINKDYLKQEAAATGDPERFQTARQSVQALWSQEDMSRQLNEKAAQKVLNFLYLMEIRQPGFTTADRLHAIHDLYVGNTLDTKFLSAVNSDTTPEEASRILAGATEHQARSNKVYPDLTDEEEKVWNRVKVYHEFDDGFKWVYAVKADGTIASHIPSNITFKTMHHCGNTPDANSDNQYWELRGPDGKAYLTVILSPEGKIEESKSWGNQPNKYRRMIQPYVKWFLKNKVSGVGYRYDYGYATHNNFGVKDFMGDDPEFIDYVVENKPELMGNTEKRIMFWKGALDQGVVTVDQVKDMFREGTTLQQLMSVPGMYEYHRDSKFSDWGEKNDRFSDRGRSVFGANPFDVVCAACGGCPFTKDELKRLVLDKKVGLEEFANYDIHMLDGDMQKAFIAASPYNLNTLLRIAGEVGTFDLSDDIMEPMIGIVSSDLPEKPEGYEHMSWMERQNWWLAKEYDGKMERFDQAVNALRSYMLEANPPEKARKVVDAVFGNRKALENIFGDDEWSSTPRHSRYSRYFHGGSQGQWINLLARFDDLDIPGPVMNFLADYMFNPEVRRNNNFVQSILRLGRPRLDPLFQGRTPKQIADFCLDTSGHLKLDSRNLLTTVKNLGDVARMFPEYAGIGQGLKPSLRLGYYCCAPDDAVDRDAAIAMAVAQIRKGENIPTNPNAMLSATGAATMMAIGKFPEIMEHVTVKDVGDYVFPQSAMICHTWVGDGAMLLSERLMDILKQAFLAMDDQERDGIVLKVAGIFMTACRRYDVLKEGDPIFNELYVHLARRWPNSETMDELTGYHFYPDIPVEELGNYERRVTRETDKGDTGRLRLLKTYVLRAMVHGKFEDNAGYLDYLMGFLLDPDVGRPELKDILSCKSFRKRAIMNKVKKALAEKMEAGEEIPIENSDWLGKAGLLKKDMLDQAELRRLDRQTEDEIDETVSSRLAMMCTPESLKRYRKSANFPYFVNSLLRANIEQYDIGTRKNGNGKNMTPEEYQKSNAFDMYDRFVDVASFLLGSPKDKACIAAAKLASHSGLLDAYRMVSERFGCKPGQHALNRVSYYRYYNGDYGDEGKVLVDEYSDLSDDFRDLIGKLDELGKTRLKYKAGDGELPLKERK